MSKIDVKKVSILGHHEVVIVSIPQPEDIAGDAIGGRGDEKILRSSLHFCLSHGLDLVGRVGVLFANTLPNPVTQMVVVA